MTSITKEPEMPQVRDFELLVLLAMLRRVAQPYANRVREDLEANAGRRVTPASGR
ncbi:MAG: hypothetical protein AAGF23_13195 [Acidobacteriota bacterium]